MIIWRYITKELYTYFVVLTIILLILFMIISFVHILSEVSKGQVGINAMIKIMITEIPSLLQPIIPISFYLAVLMVLNKLHTHHEMIILFSCGVSKFKMFLMVVLPALCLTITTSIIMFFIYPYCNNLRINIYENAIHETTIQKLTPSQFNHLGKEGIVYTQNMSKNRQKLLNIFFVQSHNDEKEQGSFDIIVAAKAEENTNKYNQKLLSLTNGMRYIGNLNESNWKMVEFEKYTKVIKNAKLRLEDWPGCLPTGELIKVAKYDRYAAAELHWRLAIPISLLILTFFALLLSDTKFQRNKITLYLPAIIIYLLYIDLLFTGMSFIKNENVQTKVGLWWAHGLMLMTALCMVFYKYSFKERISISKKE